MTERERCFDCGAPAELVDANSRREPDEAQLDEGPKLSGIDAGVPGLRLSSTLRDAIATLRQAADPLPWRAAPCSYGSGRVGRILASANGREVADLSEEWDDNSRPPRVVYDNAVANADYAVAACNAAPALCAALAQAERERALAREALRHVADGTEPRQCLGARLGEGTLECRHDDPCAACRVAYRIAQVERERDEACGALVEARRVLAWYADAANYVQRQDRWTEHADRSEIDLDEGQRARDGLAKGGVK